MIGWSTGPHLHGPSVSTGVAVMGSKVVLAPRNGAEAVALGVSACFLAVAAFVVHGDGAPTTSDSSLVAAAASSASSTPVERPRTISRPPSSSLVYGARVVDLPPPLVMLPVAEQAQAKIDAAGTPRGDGATLVTVTRGQGVLALGGGAPVVGVTAAPPAQFPTEPTAPATPTTPAAATPATTPAATTPAATTPATTPTTPSTPVAAPPTTGPTAPPTTLPETPPSTPPTEGGPGGAGDGSGSDAGTDSADAATDTGTAADPAGTSGPVTDPTPLDGGSSPSQD